MNEITKSVALNISVDVGSRLTDVGVRYDGESLQFSLKNCHFDLANIVHERLNDFNVVLADSSKGFTVIELSGSITKAKENREIKINGRVSAVTLPIPLLKDISIDNAYLQYHYVRKPVAAGETADFTDQSIALGCQVSTQGKLATVLAKATACGAYLLANDTSIVYFEFTGSIKFDELVNVICGVKPKAFSLNVVSAGFFQLSKKMPAIANPDESDTKPASKVLSYYQALRHLLLVQEASNIAGDDKKSIIPSNFPISHIGSDFSLQFKKVFKSDEIEGLAFWLEVDFSKVSLFKSLVQIGYSDQQINKLIVYGFKTRERQKQDINEHEDALDSNSDDTASDVSLFVQLPEITLLTFLTFSGSSGRAGILFHYQSSTKQYSLEGAIDIHLAPDNKEKPNIRFEGILAIDQTRLIAELSTKQSVSDPIGMTGVNLAKLILHIDKTLDQPDATPAITGNLDVAVSGMFEHTFKDVTVRLTSSIVFESITSPKGDHSSSLEARLVLIQLKSSQPLTLNHFVKGVVKQNWDWVDDVTRQFALVEGELYYVRCPKSIPEDQKDQYKFNYANTLSTDLSIEVDSAPGKAVDYLSGYHLDATLLIFEDYLFHVDVGVYSHGIHASCTYLGLHSNSNDREGNVRLFFIELTSPSITIDTRDGADFSLSVKKVRLFGDDLGDLTAHYKDSCFTGNFVHHNPDVSLEWQWTQGHFNLTKIDGLGFQELDALEHFVSKLQGLAEMSGGGCKKITKELFKGLLSTSFSPALNGRPTSESEGWMTIPLKINCNIKVGGQLIKGSSADDHQSIFPGMRVPKASDSTFEIDFPVTIKIPNSIKGLPKAIWDSATNIERISYMVGKMLDDKNTYKAIAVVLAEKGAAALAARMLCGAAKDAAEDLAKELAEKLAKKLIKAAVDELLELSGQVLSVLSVSIMGAVDGLFNLLDEIWEGIKELFGGDDNQKKAQDKLDTIKTQVDPLITSVNDSLDEVKRSIKLRSLEVTVDAKGNFVANWEQGAQPPTGKNEHLEYRLKFLQEMPNGHESPVDRSLDELNYQVMPKGNYSTPWSRLVDLSPNYQMNCSIQCRLTGFHLLDQTALDNLAATVGILNDIGKNLKGAGEFSKKLTKFISNVKQYQGSNEPHLKNNSDDPNATKAFIGGIESNVMYASLPTDRFKLGQSVLGLTTRIKE